MLCSYRGFALAGWKVRYFGPEALELAQALGIYFVSSTHGLAALPGTEYGYFRSFHIKE